MQYRIPIPGSYVGLTKDCEDRGRLFKQYVQGYINKTYPEMKLLKIEGMTAICEKKNSLAD
ncbi:hypothetical protein SAMN04488054_15121 [Salibacterium qingdaonense]|uniref:Uncharacterized protein n=1 Tax=Salibacterium qingdaonense TaxID=266892 RepID=A0A1I4QXF5_9BACI|nr:hypothetical protein SAMN04488054_15121 [Salibacterium qingdaonense]